MINQPSKGLDFVVQYARAIKYKIISQYGRIPIFPAGRQFNVGWAGTFTVPPDGAQLRVLLEQNPPIYLDALPKSIPSMVGEYTIINLSPTLSVDIVFTIANQNTSSTVVWFTVGPYGYLNQSDIEIHPAAMALKPTVAGTSVPIQFNALGYGSSE